MIENSLSVKNPEQVKELKEKLKPFYVYRYDAYINQDATPEDKAAALEALERDSAQFEALRDELRSATEEDHRLSDDLCIPNGMVVQRMISDALIVAFVSAFNNPDRVTVQPQDLHTSHIFQVLSYPLIIGTDEYTSWNADVELRAKKDHKEEAQKKKEFTERQHQVAEQALLNGTEFSKEKREHVVREGFFCDIEAEVKNVRKSHPQYADLKVSSRFREHLNEILLQYHARVAAQCDRYCSYNKTKIFTGEDYLTVLELSMIPFVNQETSREYRAFVSDIATKLDEFSKATERRKKERESLKEASLTDEERRERDRKKAEKEAKHAEELLEAQKQKIEKAQEELRKREERKQKAQALLVC